MSTRRDLRLACLLVLAVILVMLLRLVLSVAIVGAGLWVLIEVVKHLAK